MGIGTRVQYTEVPIAPGNVISNGKTYLICRLSKMLTVTEPGFYEDGKFGVRIESRCPSE